MPAHACRRSVAGMTSRILSLTLAGALALAVAPAADAAKKKPRRSSATYMTTITVDYASTWQYRQFAQHDCLPGICSREDKGSGTTTAHMETERPFPVMVIRGYGGRPPTLNLGSDGIPMEGEQIVQGADTLTYGGPWAAANPDTADPTTGCGRRRLDDFASIGWKDLQKGGGLQLGVDIDPFREDCPLGPGSQLEWEGGESLSVYDVVAAVGKGKFLGTKQFTVRGARRLKALMPTENEPYYSQNGDAEAKLQWEATFRMKGAGRKQRRG
jgi:hypothetical protein